MEEIKKVLVEGKAVPESKTEVKFGFDQLKKTTPIVATKIFRWVLYITAAANLILDTFPEIPFETKGWIAMYSIKAVALVHGFGKMFGLNLKEPGDENN